MPSNVSLLDSKCWNGGQKWVKPYTNNHLDKLVYAGRAESVATLRAEGVGEQVQTAALRNSSSYYNL